MVPLPVGNDLSW
ncbi:unnamed protein product, partial [Rotaria magnacalcarata]